MVDNSWIELKYDQTDFMLIISKHITRFISIQYTIYMLVLTDGNILVVEYTLLH